MRSIFLGLGGLLLLAGCGGALVDAQAQGGEWVVDHVEAHGAVLGVWGTGPDNVWAAGGQSDRGLMLHGDGQSWTEVQTGATSLIWNVYGYSPDDVYAVGERGLVLHFDGAGWQRVPSNTERNLYGVGGSSSDDVWAVGGAPSGAQGSAVILHRDPGGEFRPVTTLPPEYVPDVFYKVYGTPQGLLVVGDGGTALRFDGATWSRQEVPTSRPIISLWGRGNELFAVGGFGAGMVLHYDGAEWGVVQGLGATPGLNGVFTAPGLPVIAVGGQSTIFEISQNAEVTEIQAPVSSGRNVLHGVWGDRAGAVYAVGGDLDSYPSAMGGVILRRH